MSFNLRNIREVSDDTLAKFVNHLAKKLSKSITDQQIDQLENKEDIYSSGQDVESVIKFHNLTSTRSFDFQTQYYPPLEPDGDTLKIWIRGSNLGNHIDDWSKISSDRYSTFTHLNGEPLLIDGTPFDLGINTGGTKSVALRFNRPTSEFVNDENIQIDDQERYKIEGNTSGKSYFCRIRFNGSTLTSKEHGVKRTIIVKKDQLGSPTDGVHIFIDDVNQKLVFFIKKDNILYRKETASATLVTGTVYDIWCIHDPSDNSFHVYINNVNKTLTDSSYDEFWPFETDLYLMSRDEDNGHCEADLYDFRIYDRVVSASEVQSMYTNKWTISNIPFGQVMVANYWATFDEVIVVPVLLSYTSTSYTSTSYTTTPSIIPPLSSFDSSSFSGTSFT